MLLIVSTPAQCLHALSRVRLRLVDEAEGAPSQVLKTTVSAVLYVIFIAPLAGNKCFNVCTRMMQ